MGAAQDGGGVCSSKEWTVSMVKSDWSSARESRITVLLKSHYEKNPKQINTYVYVKA